MVRASEWAPHGTAALCDVAAPHLERLWGVRLVRAAQMRSGASEELAGRSSRRHGGAVGSPVFSEHGTPSEGAGDAPGARGSGCGSTERRRSVK